MIPEKSLILNANNLPGRALDFAAANNKGSTLGEKGSFLDPFSTLLQPFYNPFSTLFQPFLNPFSPFLNPFTTLLQPFYNPFSTLLQPFLSHF